MSERGEELSDYRPGDVVKNATLGIGRVERVSPGSITVLYYDSQRAHHMRGIYSTAWFTAHPDNMRIVPQEILEVA